MAQSHLIEAIEKGTGKFDNKRQYAFTNWSDKDFTFKWAGEDYHVKAGEMSVYPQYLAYHACKHFVSQQMIAAGQEVMYLNASARAEYENKTIQEIAPGEENPIVATIREQERMKLIAEMGLDSAADAAVTNSETRREMIEQSRAAIEAEPAVAAEEQTKKVTRTRKEFAGAKV